MSTPIYIKITKLFKYIYQEINAKILNPYLPNVPFPYHLKTLEN